MFTQCPACHTIYALDPAQLTVAQGLVRCGACRQVYNALDHLAAELPPRAEAMARRMHQGASGRTAADAPVPAASAVYFPPDGARAAALPHHPVATSLWITGIVLALAVLVLQYAYFMRGDLAEHAALRPWLERLCGVAGCRLPPRRDVAQIAVLKRQVIEDPTEAGTLLVRATIENKAPFAQPYPILQLSLSDINGRLLGRGRFTPQQYLAGKDTPVQIPSRTPVDIRLRIADPGSGAVNFEFTFL